MKGCLIFALCSGLLTCCSFEKKNTATAYLDTHSLFAQEIEQLSHQSKGLTKTLRFGDSLAIQKGETVNWSKELQPFTEIDLYKKSYKGRFAVSTKDSADDFLLLTYIATDAKTDLRSLTVTLNRKDSSMRALSAEFTEENALYSAKKNLCYFADSLFTIDGSQRINLGKVIDYSVVGVITEGR